MAEKTDDVSSLITQFRAFQNSMESATESERETFRNTIKRKEFFDVYPTEKREPVLDMRSGNEEKIKEQLLILFELTGDSTKSPNKSRNKNISKVAKTIANSWLGKYQGFAVLGPARVDTLFMYALSVSDYERTNKLRCIMKKRADDIVWQTPDGKPSKMWKDYNWELYDEIPMQKDRHEHAFEMIAASDKRGKMRAPHLPIVYRLDKEIRGHDPYAIDDRPDARTLEGKGAQLREDATENALPSWVRRSGQWTQLEKMGLPCRGCNPTDRYTNYAMFVLDPDAPANFDVQLYVGSATDYAKKRWATHVKRINAALAGEKTDVQLVEAVMARAFMENNTGTWDGVAVVICLESFGSDTMTIEKEHKVISDMRLCYANFGLNVKK